MGGFDEVRVSPWRPFPVAGYAGAPDRVRIWQRLTPFGMFQAHEWGRPDGTAWREAWIPGIGRRWGPNAVPADDPDAPGLVAALRAIAAGHNDPRALARAALEAAGIETAPDDAGAADPAAV